MKNDSKIAGDDNVVIQGSKNSEIKVDKRKQRFSEKQNYALLAVIVAVLGIIITVVIGWDNIIKFFSK